MVNQPGERVPVIDGLRGTAILMVVLFHVFVQTHFAFGLILWGWHLNLRTVVQAGFLGVEVFFFVSGFCLMLPYAGWLVGRREKQSWAEYASRRFWKIVPSYYFALAIMAFFPVNPQPGISRAADVALHAFFAHSFNENAYPSLNSNFWSLAVEVQFYLVFPILVWAFARRPLAAATLAIAFALAFSTIIAVTGQAGYFQWSYSLPSFLPLFVMGAACAYVYERWIRSAEFAPELRAQMAVLSVTALGALLFYFEQMNRLGGGPIVWEWQNDHRLAIALLLSIFTLAALCAPPRFQNAVANRPLRFFSDISYNMYLWNSPAVLLVAAHWAGNDGWRGGIFCLLALGVTTIAGYSLTYILERPLMRNRWNSPRRAALAVASLFRRPVRSADNG